MGYVFGKAFWWILLALLIGGVIGYYWNGWRRKRWVDSSSTTSSSTVTGGDDSGENMRLRTRVAELQDDLDAVVAERDELVARVATLEADLDDCRSQAAAEPAMAVGMMPDTSGDDAAEDGAATIQGFAAVAADEETDEATVEEPTAPEYDLEAAAAAIGKRIKVDDLKIVEGIGPKIEELINDGGINTWAELAAAPVERLQEILDAAGERFRIHDPGTWPRQAGLLAESRWDEFKQLTDELDGGRE